MGVSLKKKILRYCMIAVWSLVILSLFVKSPSKTSKEVNNISLASISMNKSGCITLEENEFFKKYTINCSNDLNDLNCDDKENEFSIILNKADISNINISSSEKVDFSEISAKVNDSNYLVTFKKLNKDENYAHLDANNKKKIIVLISKKRQPYKFKVVVDPGHGGNDAGTIYENLYEKNLTLKISLAMEDNLRFNGCEPIYTRKTDKYVEYKDTPKFISDSNADVFVSVHINYNKDKNCEGLTTYYYPPSGKESDEWINLAKSVQSEIVKEDNWKDRGVMKNKYFVISHNNMPSILIECGFIGNDNDRAKLSNDEVLNNLGKNISNGVVNYLSQKH